MSYLKVVVFNVQFGLCVYVRTPSGHAVLIDCGKREGFSPAEWIAAHEAPFLQRPGGFLISDMVVTHPHDDHVEDIGTIRKALRPRTLHCQTGYDWRRVLQPPDGQASGNVRSYYDWLVRLKRPPLYPRLDVSGNASWRLGDTRFSTFALSPAEAADVDGVSQHVLNNSSIATVISCAFPKVTWAITVCGDTEKGGWDVLLKRPRIRSLLKGTQFFVTPHHGHESGFHPGIFAAMGDEPILNISSLRERDQSACGRYSACALGILDLWGNNHYHLTTRQCGRITICMFQDCRFTVEGTDDDRLFSP